jgi:hypothetical protein
MDLNTNNVIKSLGIGSDLKEELLANLEKYLPDQKYQITKLIWDTYFALYKLKEEEIFDQFRQKALKNEETLDEGFYERVRLETDRVMREKLLDSTSQVELSSVRQKLQHLISNS